MHSSCVYFHALNYIYVIVISTWPWYMTCVLSTLNYLYVISLVLCSFVIASAFYSDANELYYLYSCLFHIFWVHHVGLVHISLTNTFVLIDKSLYDPSMLKTSTLSHTRGSIVINHQKGGDWKHLGPSWVSVINDNTWLLWLICVLQRQLS